MGACMIYVVGKDIRVIKYNEEITVHGKYFHVNLDHALDLTSKGYVLLGYAETIQQAQEKIPEWLKSLI